MDSPTDLRQTLRAASGVVPTLDLDLDLVLDIDLDVVDAPAIASWLQK